MRAGLLLSVLVLAAAGPAIAAAGAASAPALPAFDKPCVGIGATAAADDPDDPAGMSTFVAHGKAAIELVAKELEKRRFKTDVHFREPPESHEQGQRTFEWLLRTRCVRYVQITFVARREAAGPYFGYDVQVGRMSLKPAGAGKPASLEVVPVFTRQYHHPRTAQALARFDPAPDVARIVADLVANASLPTTP